jgi:hypothetical protein
VPDLVADTSECPSTVSDSDVLASLAGFNMSGSATGANESAISANVPQFDRNVSIDQRFESLMYSTNGVLFGGVQIQIGGRSPNSMAELRCTLGTSRFV